MVIIGDYIVHDNDFPLAVVSNAAPFIAAAVGYDSVIHNLNIIQLADWTVKEAYTNTGEVVAINPIIADSDGAGNSVNDLNSLSIVV